MEIIGHDQFAGCNHRDSLVVDLKVNYDVIYLFNARY